MATVQIRVDGKIVGKQRPKFSRQGALMKTYTPEKTVTYENYVRLCWMQNGADKLNGLIKATIDAHFRIPTSVSKKRHIRMLNTGCPKKPDADNIAKSILDALNGIAYDDDAQVVVLEVIKTYDDEEFVRVTLEEINYEELSEL